MFYIKIPWLSLNTLSHVLRVCELGPKERKKYFRENRLMFWGIWGAAELILGIWGA